MISADSNLFKILPLHVSRLHILDFSLLQRRFFLRRFVCLKLLVAMETRIMLWPMRPLDEVRPSLHLCF